jgi:hypothetical protein
MADNRAHAAEGRSVQVYYPPLRQRTVVEAPDAYICGSRSSGTGSLTFSTIGSRTVIPRFRLVTKTGAEPSSSSSTATAEAGNDT